MIDACLEAEIVPNVTINHFTIPRWLDQLGGWRASEVADRSARFTEFLHPILERDGPYVCTINEPNTTACMANLDTSAAFQASGCRHPTQRSRTPSPPPTTEPSRSYGPALGPRSAGRSRPRPSNPFPALRKSQPSTPTRGRHGSWRRQGVTTGSACRPTPAPESGRMAPCRYPKTPGPP